MERSSGEVLGEAGVAGSLRLEPQGSLEAGVELFQGGRCRVGSGARMVGVPDVSPQREGSGPELLVGGDVG